MLLLLYPTARLTLPDYKQPSVVDIDAGVRAQHRLNTLCLTPMRIFAPDDRIRTR